MSFRLERGRPCDAELRRVVLFQIGRAEAHCRNVARDPFKSPHEARKAIKKIRAALRLARFADEAFYREENSRWREISAALAGPREMGALIETVDRFIDEFANRENRSTLLTLRARLVVRSDALGNDTRALEAASEACIQGCGAARAAIGTWPLPGGVREGAHLLAKGVKTTWREADAARRRAARLGEEDDFHDLRKAVKRHWTHLGLLQDFWPGPTKQRRKAVEVLGERLGEFNDIHVMNALMRDGDIETDFDARGLFAAMLARKSAELRAASLNEARRLFGHPPGGLRSAFEAATSAGKGKATKPAEAA